MESFRSLYEIEPGEIDLCTFPLFALFAPALGMTAIVPDMDPTRPARVEPARIFEAIDDFGVTNMFGSPALLRRLAQAGNSASVRLPTLKRVISAGVPVSPKTMDQLVPLLDRTAQIYTPYGATEALPVASIGSGQVLRETRHATDKGMGVCVGRPVAGIDARIIQIRDDPIPSWSDDLQMPDGEIGEIIVAGPVVTKTYYNRSRATSLAKIADPDRQTFFHRMGDLGYRDSQGRLWFCGRKSHRVILAEETLFTIPCESIFNAHAEVARSALVGVRRHGWVVPVICVEPLQLAAAIGEGPHRTRIARARRSVPSYLEDQDDSFSSVVSRRYQTQRQDFPRKAGRLGLEEGPVTPVNLGPVLVTGGGGFLGTALIKLLVQRGLAVRSLSRRAYPHLQELGVEQVPGDVADVQVVNRAVEGCQTIFHTAAKAGIWGSDHDYERTNVAGTHNVIAACRAHGFAADHLQQLAQCGL